MPTTINVLESALSELSLFFDDSTSDSEIMLSELSGIVTVSDPTNTLAAGGSAIQNGNNVETSAPVSSIDVTLGDGRNIFTATNVSTAVSVIDGNGYSTIKTGLGDDSIMGGSGKNKIDGGAGADSLDGGGGSDDTVEYTNSNAAVVVNLATSSGSGGYADGDIIDNFENISGSAFSDSLTGDDNKNIIRGREGDDMIVGNEGDDRLFGNAGNDNIQGNAGKDFIRGGAGADTLDGGDGSDTIYYVDSATRVKVYLDRGKGNLGDAAQDVIVNVENVIGSDHDDYLSGDAQGNTLKGGVGNDALLGRDGKDNLKGGIGSDMLEGGRDADMLEGGDGSDTFKITNFRDSLLGDRDRITDLEIGQDQIRGRYAVASADINAYTVANFGKTAFEDALTETTFEAQSAAVVTLGSLTLLALNDNTAGFQSDKDAIIDITGYTGDINSLSVIA